MIFIQPYLILSPLILSIMVLLWLVSLGLKNSSIVDIFWGTGFVIFTWLAFILTPEGFVARKLMLSVLVTIWGLRLSMYILRRNWGKPEDYRYQTWRKEAGASWWWKSFFKVFMLQGIILLIVAAPVLIAQVASAPDHLTWLDILAVPLWFVGFIFESVGDWQLMHFKSDPANQGRLLTSGVWRYSRHPNYFGDATQWWAFYLIALAAGSWWTIFSPVIMTVLLLRISGVTMLEKTLKETRIGYQEYIDTTNEFIPWFPHRKE